MFSYFSLLLIPWLCVKQQQLGQHLSGNFFQSHTKSPVPIETIQKQQQHNSTNTFMNDTSLLWEGSLLRCIKLKHHNLKKQTNKQVPRSRVNKLCASTTNGVKKQSNKSKSIQTGTQAVNSQWATHLAEISHLSLSARSKLFRENSRESAHCWKSLSLIFKYYISRLAVYVKDIVQSSHLTGVPELRRHQWPARLFQKILWDSRREAATNRSRGAAANPAPSAPPALLFARRRRMRGVGGVDGGL